MGLPTAYRLTGTPAYLDAAVQLARKAESLMGDAAVPVWDYALPADGSHPIDSSAAAVTAAGVLLLADLLPMDQAADWRCFGHRLLDGLLAQCDLTATPCALGFLSQGAAHVPAGRSDAMLPYGDYYFTEALMRALGHRGFFW